MSPCPLRGTVTGAAAAFVRMDFSEGPHNGVRGSRLASAARLGMGTLLAVAALLVGVASAWADAVQAVVVTPTAVPESSGFSEDATGSWSGERRSLQNLGIEVNAQWVAEGFYNATGGRARGADWATTFDVDLGLDTGKAFHWKGGLLYADLEDHSGRNPTVDLTGDHPMGGVVPGPSSPRPARRALP